MIIIQTQCPKCSRYENWETKKPESLERHFYQNASGDFRCINCGIKLDEEVAIAKLHNSISLLIHGSSK